MSPSGCETTPVVSVVCSLTLGQLPADFKTLEEVLLAPKATRLLSPLIEKRALEAATGRNFRPAAAELSRWLRTRGERVAALALCAVSRSEVVPSA
jgi:hypothetical protein